MKRLVLLSLLFASGSLWATSGPLLRHKDENTQREFEEVYHGITYPDIANGTAQVLTISTLSVTGRTTGIGGRVIQTSTGTSTTQFCTTSGTNQTTNLSASITPLFSTSKIKISVTAGIVNDNAPASNENVSLFRDTSLLIFPTIFNITGTLTQARAPYALTYLDAPASVASLTYAMKIASNGGTNVCFGVGNEDQYMLLEEIAQ